MYPFGDQEGWKAVRYHVVLTMQLYLTTNYLNR